MQRGGRRLVWHTMQSILGRPLPGEVHLSRTVVRGIVGLILIAGLGFRLASASTVVVPDAFSTVQLAIDSGADTVLIREGIYRERPVVDHAVVLQGVGMGNRPRLDGLQIFNTNFWANLLSVSRVAFSGRVEHMTLYVHPRNLVFAFSDCSLDSGFYQVRYLDADDVASLTIRSSHLGGGSRARADWIVMDADTIDGGVSWNAGDVSIVHCWFRGGPGAAIELYSGELRGGSSHNMIEHYDTGIYIEEIGSACAIDENTISMCGAGILVNGGYSVDIEGNDIRDCGTGIDVNVGEVTVVGNTILRAGGDGIVGHHGNLLVASGGCAPFLGQR